jgi:hypothetical protein
MKTILFSVLTMLNVILFSGCVKDFLEKPIGSNLTVDSVFSTKQKSLSAITRSYSMSLASGIRIADWDGAREYGMTAGTLSHLSGEVNSVKFSWEDAWQIQRSGMTANDGNGAAITDDGFGFNFKSIRQNNLVIENIDLVSDMSTQEKNQVKAEMKVLNAYRYEEMFKRYGGVPVVTHSLSVVDSINIPRSSLQATLDHIIKLCDEAATALPNDYPREMKGRITRGVALAVKAEALMFAARPLFNSATPYLDLGANNNLICFGKADQALWQKAADASKDVIDWAQTNGCQIINTGNPLQDYGTAVATPGNVEVLLAYKYQSPFLMTYNPHSQDGGANGMSFTQLQQYRKADGNEQTWAGTTPAPYSEYAAKMQAMEPRYKASAVAAGIDAWNNPNSAYWKSDVLSTSSTWNGIGGTEACGRRAKFWYLADTRNWFEFPLYRLSEFYLNMAEAYNELGQVAQSRQYLNVIRSRAGLPVETENDPSKLRKIIQREWAVEFYEENHRLFDVKHWKLSDIGNGIIGGPKKSFIFSYKNGEFGLVAGDYIDYSTQVVYTGFWNTNQFLNPFPANEVNKGYLVQNPGY